MFRCKTYREFIKTIQDSKYVVQELQCNKLLKPLGKCKQCRRQRVLIKNEQFKEGYAARCPKCRRFSALTPGTFFENTKLSIKNILEVIYCWSKNLSQLQTSELTGITRVAVNQYYRYIRDVCSWKLIQDEERFVFGGPGHTVQIDESVISKRKYNRGRIVKEKWVLGIYDATTKKGIIIYVPKRNAATLLPIIQKHVLPGSTIWTDQWRAYNDLSEMGYLHQTVNHSINFKNPETGVCTNSVEGFWRVMKAYFRKKCVQGSINIEEHIDEFMLRQTYLEKTRNGYQTILEHIKERYPM